MGGGKSYVVLLAKLLGERGAHDDAADAGGGAEVRLARLPPRGGNGCVALKSAIVYGTICIGAEGRTGVNDGHRGGGVGVVEVGGNVVVSSSCKQRPGKNVVGEIDERNLVSPARRRPKSWHLRRDAGMHP